MAIGKNKRKPKKTTKKTVDAMAKKDWYRIRAPPLFTPSGQVQAPPVMVGWTFANRDAAGKLASDALVGRVFTISLADMIRDNGEDQSYKNMRLVTEAVVGDTCLTNFYGMTLTSDRIKSLVRKWHTLIDVIVNATTTDGNQIRIFAITFTKRRPGQVRKTCYAQTSRIKVIRAKIRQVITNEIVGCDLRQLMVKVATDVICKNIEAATSGILQLQNTHIYKIKIIKRAKTGLAQLREMYGDVATSTRFEDIGVAV